MYKCSKIEISLNSAQNVKSQQMVMMIKWVSFKVIFLDFSNIILYTYLWHIITYNQ